MKKTLSIILAILMIVTTVPFAFAAEETPDFSDAKVLSSDTYGYLRIDGVKVSVDSNGSMQFLPAGKYILNGDINSAGAYIDGADSSISIDLNGYQWDMGKKYLFANGIFSLYDTSEDETGKITGSFRTTIDLTVRSDTFNLYSGTIENTSSMEGAVALEATYGNACLYGGKLVSKESAVSTVYDKEKIIKLGDVIFDCGKGFSHIRGSFQCNVSETLIDVSDYKGEDLTVSADVFQPGKFTVFTGIENAQEAERYALITTNPYAENCLYLEKTEYDEVKGEKSFCFVENAFIQQPTADNGYTAEFNNPASTLQWYEIEEIKIGTYTVKPPESGTLFTYNAKAGDLIEISTESECRDLDISLTVGERQETFSAYDNKVTYIIESDAAVSCKVRNVIAEKPVNLNARILRETALEGEMSESLHGEHCKKSYWCKATIHENAYLSDVVTVDHNIVIDEAVAPDCTNTGLTEGSHCSRCEDMTIDQDVVPALNHKDTLMQTDAKVPNCTEIGWNAYEYRTACDYTTYEEIPALGHVDDDGDYICDNGCGHEFEKPEEPTDDVCEDCGKVHTNFFSEIICFFTKIINFIKNLFA